MLKLAPAKIKRLVSYIATVALVLETLLPGGIFNWPAERAAAGTNAWDFTSAGDYTARTYASVIDHYAVNDLVFWTSSDNMDTAYGGVTDLVETDTNGRIIAAVNTIDASPYSTDYGAYWSPAIMTTSDNLHIRLTKANTGPYTGRIIAGGRNTLSDVAITRYSTDEGATWTAANTVAANTTQVTALKFVNGRLYAGTGGGTRTNDGLIFQSILCGEGDWVAKAPAPQYTVASIDDFASANGGNRILAAVTVSSGQDTTEAPIVYSDDGGATWQAATTTDNGGIAAAVRLTVSADGMTIYATSSGAHAYWKSTDGGSTFAWVGTIEGVSSIYKPIYLDAAGGVIAINGYMVYRSLDGGTDWNQQSTDVFGNVLHSGVLIRMSDHRYLLGVTTAGGVLGDVYTGSYFAMVSIVVADYTVSNNTGVAFTSLSGFSDTYASTSEGSAIKYQIRAASSGDWYYWNGSQWAPNVSGLGNTATDINTHIGQFASDLGLGDSGGSFYFRALLSTATVTTYGSGKDSVVLDTVTLTYENTTGGGPPPPDTERKSDKTPPTSKVVGILENGERVSMPPVIYESAFTIVAEASDNLALNNVELFFALNKPTGFVSWGKGTPDPGNGPSSGYWSWNFNTGGKDGTYYFYSLATDMALPPNIEVLPKRPGWKYDAFTTVNTQRPYIEQTSPAEGGTKIGIDSSIIVWFSWDMDPQSVEAAFMLTRGSGQGGSGGGGGSGGEDLNWSFNWHWKRGLNGYTSVRINHTIPFECSTQYTALIIPFIAKDVNGLPLDDSGTKGVANPWHFTTDMPQKPDLSNSEKNVVIYDRDTSLPKDEANPGDYLHYTITITNSDPTVADKTTLLDWIPAHTTFDDTYGVHVRYWGGMWIAMQPPPQRESYFEAWYEAGAVRGQGTIVQGKPVYVDFMVKINQPLANGTVITNTAEISDGVNPTHYKLATVIVKSASNWEHSYKEADKGTAKVNDRVTYTIYIENSGDMDATNVVVTDQVPAYTSHAGTPTGGLVYDPDTNRLSWEGAIGVGQNKTFTFQVDVDEQPPSGRIINTTSIVDEAGNFTMVIEIIIIPDNTTPPYIVSPTQPKEGETSVKLFSPIVITFSDSIVPTSLKYIVTNQTTSGEESYDNSKDKGWTETWTPNPDGKPNARVTIQPDKPFHSGRLYIVYVSYALGVNGKPLSKYGDVPDNTWTFTTARPALYFTDNSVLSLVAGTVSEAIVVRLGDWVNFEDQNASTPQYRDYQVENPGGISIQLLATSPTGRFDTDPKGKFDGSIISVLMPQGGDTITFYYTDPTITSPTFYKILPYNISAGYSIISVEERLVLTTAKDEQLTSDQIYFRTGMQTIPAGELSGPIQFEIRNPKGELVTIKRGCQFLLETTSLTGEFYDQFKLPIDQYVTLQGNQEIKTYYQLTMNADTTRATFYYQDSDPGVYLIKVNDKSLLVAAEASGPANSGAQQIIVAPINDQDLKKELLEELEDVKDENRKLDYVTINPTETTVLPSGVRTFKAEGFDTTGKEVKELKFSWYVISGGGTILKKGLSKDNHSSVFTAGKIPGIYADTVLVATMYNGEIQAALASVTVADVVNYGGPGELPSTGPNGIQLLFIVLTLLSAVALAGVEHYEKTHFEEGAQPAK